MRSRYFTASLVALAGLALSVVVGSSPAFAQTRITSLEQLRRELAKDDEITVVTTDGQMIAGRLTRIGSQDIDVRRRRVGATVSFDRIHSLERRRDSARNGLVVGAAVGAAAGAGLFLTAVVIDRNEIEEWGPLYATTSVAFAGVGALIGWAVDARMSKPSFRFEDAVTSARGISIQPRMSRRGGVGIVVLVSP